MGIIIRQSAISTVLTYAGVAIGYVNVLILYPKYMSPDEVGLARLIQDAAMLMVPFAQLGIGQLTIRYFPEYNVKKHYGEFVSLVFGLLVISLILFSALFLLFKTEIGSYFMQHSPEVPAYLNYILMLILIMSVNQILVAFCQSSLNIVLPNFLKEVWLRALTLTGIILFATGIFEFTGFVIFLLMAYGASLLILALYLFQKKVIHFSLQNVVLNRQIIKPMISYALITFLGASGILIIGKVDSLMVTGMLGLTENAIYTTAFYVAVLIELPKRAVAQIGLPVISRAFEKNDLAEVNTIYRKSALNNLIIGLLIFIGLWINLDNLYTLIPRTEVYSLGSMVVLIIGAGKLFDMAAGLNGEIIVMSKHYKVNVYLIILLAIVTITANLLLIPIYGLNGAAIGSAIALILFNLAKYLFILFRMRIQPFSVQTLKTLAIGALVLALGIWLPQLQDTYLDILYRSAIVSIIFGASIYMLNISEDINNIVNKLIGRRS